MADDFSMLSPNVREAYATLDAEVAPAGHVSYEAYRAWCTIHAELLRLARENTELRNARAVAIADLQYHKQLLQVESELADAREAWHLANGCADLAMQHRDAAEAELAAAIQAQLEAMGDDIKGVSWFSSVAEEYANTGTQPVSETETVRQEILSLIRMMGNRNETRTTISIDLLRSWSELLGDS